MSEFEKIVNPLSNPFSADLEKTELLAKTLVCVIEHTDDLADDEYNVMRDLIHDEFMTVIGGCSLALVQTEYLYPLATPTHIPRNPTAASSATVVIDTTQPIEIRAMPFKSDFQRSETEWTGVGFIARAADKLDLTPRLKDVHEDFGLAPSVAVPLFQNITTITRLINTTPN